MPHMPRLSSFGDLGLTMHLIFAPSSDVLQEACHLEHSRRDRQVECFVFSLSLGEHLIAAASNGSAIDCICTSATHFAGVPPDSQRLSGKEL